MWILHLLPDNFILYVVYALLGIGLIGILVVSFLRVSPFINIYRIPLLLFFIAVFCSGIYWYGGYEVEMLWRAKVAEMEDKLKEVENKQPQVTKQIVYKTKDKIVIVKQGVEVVKKEIEIQREVINADCKLNPTAVEAYNKGIAGPKEESK